MKFFGKGTRSRIVEDKEEKLEVLLKYFQHHVQNRCSNNARTGAVLIQKINQVHILSTKVITDAVSSVTFPA